MPARYFLDEDHGLLVTQVSGILRDRDLVDLLDKIVEETGGAGFYRPHLFLIEQRTSMHDLTFEGLVRLKDSIEARGKSLPGRDVKTAIVAPQDDQATVARLWQAMTEAHRSIGATVELFSAEEDAIAWLTS